MTPIEIPARRGKAAFIAAGQTVTVINTHGEQVIDTWAFSRTDLSEFMSNEHSRAHTLHLVPKVGDVLRTNRRRPILTLTEDTSGGIHTLGFAAPPQPVPGGHVRLRAEMDLVIAFSACPQDILPINGTTGKTVEAHFTIS